MQAYSGLMSVNGHPEQEPARVGTSIIDMGTGMWAALGIVAALRQRDTTGRAVEVTTALFETALMWMSYHAMGFMGSGVVPQPQGSGTAMIAPYQAFPTADGFAMIGAGSDALFARLIAALGCPELSADPRFKDNPSRVSNRIALVEALSARTRERKAAELVEALRAAGVPASPILSVDQMLQEPQTRESGAIVGAPHPRLSDYRSVGLPLTWDGVRPAVRRVPPLLGEHSSDVLTWLGYTLDDVRSLKGKASSSDRDVPPSSGDALGRRARRHGDVEPAGADERDEHRDGRGPPRLLRRLPARSGRARDRVHRRGDKAFCAGGDLKERNAMTDEAWRAQHVIFEQAAFRVLRCPVPVIAAVEGFALAGGCELAILSDFIVAGETAVFGVPETTLGIFRASAARSSCRASLARPWPRS
jgi:hypothetical protein